MPFVLFLGICVCVSMFMCSHGCLPVRKTLSIWMSQVWEIAFCWLAHISALISIVVWLSHYTHWINKTKQWHCVYWNKYSQKVKRIGEVYRYHIGSVVLVQKAPCKCVDVHTNYHFIRLTEHLCRSSTKIDIMPKHIRHDCFHIVLILRWRRFQWIHTKPILAYIRSRSICCCCCSPSVFFLFEHFFYVFFFR